ncbi:MAG: MBL fold metallo-hydrolase [Brevinematia bacterium]
MRITTLIENTVYQSGLIAEHGLSIYIEGEKRILFDTGQSDDFIKNATMLGINLEKIDTVIISHGHYDHAGGLKHFCNINSKAKIYVKEGFFTPKYRDRQKFIGIENIFPQRIIFVKNKTELFSDIFIIPEIKIENNWDTHFEGMFIKTAIGFEVDEFNDELFLVIKKDGKINIISGCSHRGITNIILSAKKEFENPINLVLGGFHTKGWNKERMEKLINNLQNFEINSIGCCHCTGIENYALIKEVFKEKAFYNSTGNIIDF